MSRLSRVMTTLAEIALVRDASRSLLQWLSTSANVGPNVVSGVGNQFRVPAAT